jgi:L-aminopeptidase/D-esterase-like protein
MTDNPQNLPPGPHNAITDIDGIRVGHFTNLEAATGTTVIRCEASKFVAVDVRGGAPASRETDVLAVGNVVRRCDAVVLGGGSAFGLAASDGVARYLAEHEIGFETRAGHVPIVSGASIFDLGFGETSTPPDADAGYAAVAAAADGPVKQGTVGGGTGATVAKLLGSDRRIKGGVGTASLVAENGLTVAAISVTNAIGNIVDPDDGSLVAGSTDGPAKFATTEQSILGHASAMDAFRDNTTLVCLATNADFDHVQTHRLAMLAHDGMARAIIPAHTMGDGDIAFAISMGTFETDRHDVLLAGHMAARVASLAILNSVRQATTLADVTSAADWLAG